MTGARARGRCTRLDWMGSCGRKSPFASAEEAPALLPGWPWGVPKHLSKPRLLLRPGPRLPSHSESSLGRREGAACGEGELWDLTGIQGSPGPLGQKEVGPSRPGVRAGSCQVCTCCAYLLSWPRPGALRSEGCGNMKKNAAQREPMSWPRPGLGAGTSTPPPPDLHAQQVVGIPGPRPSPSV